MARAATISAAAGAVLGGLVALSPAAAATTSCATLGETLAAIEAALPRATSPAALEAAIARYGAELEAEAGGGTVALRRAVAAFVTDLRAAGRGQVDVAQLTADATAITNACAAAAPGLGARGAPQTGAGTTAGFADTDLLVAGAIAIVAGGAVAGTAWGRARRSGA